MMPDQEWRRSWCGAAVSFGLLRQSRDRGWRDARRELRGLVTRFGELHCPGALLGSVDLEEAGAVITAREAVLDALDGEFLVARTHEGLARPFAAAVVVDRIHIVETRDELTFHQSFAFSWRQVPPALSGPAFGVLVADRDADPAAGVVAEIEVRRGRFDESEKKQRADSKERRPAQRAGHDTFHPDSADPHHPLSDFAPVPSGCQRGWRGSH